MTILPHKPKPKVSQVDTVSTSEVSLEQVASSSDLLNRPSTSRTIPATSNVNIQSTNQIPSAHEVAERRLAKSLKRASGTPPPNNSKKLSKKIAEQQSQQHEGYNSEDEYQTDTTNEDLNPATLLDREIQFERAMKAKGFTLRRMAEDGCCLFRAVADQVYGDQRWHDVVRRQCIDHMEKNRDYYSAFVTEEFDQYLQRKRRLDCFGNSVEIQAMSEIYGRPVEIYRYSTEPINIFQASSPSNYPALRFSYHNRSHYNSIVSPYEATVGVGLGLPGYQPGIADHNLMRDASLISENCAIEKAMLEDKLRETDWEKTQDALEKQVARESYVQWMREQEERLIGTCAPENERVDNIPSTSSTSLHQDVVDKIKPTDLLASGPSCSQDAMRESPSKISPAINQTQQVSSETPISWEDWIVDEAAEKEIMLAVIARSQEDYMNTFSNTKTELPSGSGSGTVSESSKSVSRNKQVAKAEELTQSAIDGDQ